MAVVLEAEEVRNPRCSVHGKVAPGALEHGIAQVMQLLDQLEARVARG